MRGKFSLIAVAALFEGVSGAIIPVAEFRDSTSAVVESPKYSVPGWILSLAAGYVIRTDMRWFDMRLMTDF